MQLYGWFFGDDFIAPIFFISWIVWREMETNEQLDMRTNGYMWKLWGMKFISLQKEKE